MPRAALELARRRAEAKPEDAEAARDLMESYFNIGEAVSERSSYVDAQHWLSRARQQGEAMIQRGQMTEKSAEFTKLKQAISECEAKLKKAADHPPEKAKPASKPDHK